ncbi:MAG: S49 family peptidase, partial [Marinobacterium sp.]|nr:S49 family peptidase [Marinobacterium sp.]
MALASSAHRRLITQTGIAGSIGVVMAHASYEKHLEDAGIKVTLIHSGAQKVDGNPYGDLPAEVLAKFQQNSDQLRLEFAQLVSAHMGISVEKILATEAATCRGQEAIDIGLADELVNGHEIIAHFIDHLSTQGKTTSLGVTMSDDTEKPQAQTPETKGPAAGAEQPAPVASAPTASPAADAAVTPEAAAAAALERVQGIMGLEGAADYSATTNYIAFNTGLTVEQAKGLLATLPAPSTTDRMNTALDNAMANEQQPEVGADAGQPSAGNQLLADYEMITGDK